MGPIILPQNTVAPALATTSATMTGNLPNDAPTGTVVSRDVDVYDGMGTSRTVTMNMTRTAAGWNVAATDGSASGTDSLVFTAGKLTSGATMTIGGVTVDFGGVTGYAGLTTVVAARQDGRQAGTLQAFSIAKDGSLVGSYSNGATVPIAQLAMATFTNPQGLEKAGSSNYRSSINTGDVTIATAGSPGVGTLAGGSLEMSNVDLSQEFTNLIVAQRGFQANARIITTSDEILQELTNLKR
jgi:flagellar hook protein FlgE